MADKHHASLKVVNSIGQCVDRLQVQMIGRLIEKQQMWSLPCKPRKYHTTPLTV